MIEKKGRLFDIVISLAIPLGVGLLSSLLVMDSYEMYQELTRPSFAPPSSIFAPAWTILYILMGIASYLVWKSNADKKQIDDALLFYFIQLSLNFIWPILFFKFDMKFLAFINIIILLIFIVITTTKFYKIKKVAGYLMIPYILWVSFATVLNYSIWMLNR